MHKLQGKKIIFLFTPGPIGGAEKIVLYGINALIKEKVDIALWVIKEERVPHVVEEFIELIKDEGINPLIFSSHRIYDRKLLKNLRNSFSKSSPAIIHAHGFKAAFYAHFSAPKSSDIIITHHGKTGHTLKVKLYEFIEDQMMKRSEAVIAVSQDMKKKLSTAGIKENKIVVVENFMTTTIVPIVPNNKLPIKLLFVGRLSPEKGCSILIEAMIKLDQKKFNLTVLGDGVEKVELQRKVKEFGLNESITFTGFKKNVNEYMSACDAIVMPSFREGQPLTLIEACCMGLPVVASNVGGIPELVKENINGYLCRPGDPSELALALEKLSQNLVTVQISAKNQAQNI